MKTSDLLKDGHLSDQAAAFIVDSLLHRQALDTNMREEVLNHVEECKECKDKIIDVVTFLRNPDSIGAAPVQRQRKRQKRYFYRGKIAAVFVTFALLLFAYFFIYKNPSVLDVNRYKTDDAKNNQLKQEIQVKKSDSPSGEIKSKETKPTVDIEPIEPKPDEPAAGKKKSAQLPDPRYHVNPNLENMIGSHLRSGFLEVLTPIDNSELTSPIHFSWKRGFVKPHTLKIVNNKNNVLYKYPVQGSSFDFKGKLRPGLYYWKLENRNELLYVGKFFVYEATKDTKIR